MFPLRLCASARDIFYVQSVTANILLIEFTENKGKLQLSNRDRRLNTTGSGKVIGSVAGLSGKPVPEAAVFPGINSVNTDNNGEFQFLNVSNGLRYI